MEAIGAINMILLLLAIAAFAGVVMVTQEPRNARKVAAWLIGRAYYLENLRAERLRWREMAQRERRRMEEQLEVA